MQIVFVNRYFHPDFSATSQMLSDLAFSLAAGGFSVTVVTSRQIYDAPEARLPAVEQVKGVNVYRVRTTTFGRERASGRLLDYLSFHFAAAFRLARLLRGGDIVVAKTDPPLLSVSAALVARLRGAQLVNWLQDLFPEVLGAAAPASRFSQWLLGALQGLRNRSLHAAARNVTVGRLMARRLVQQGIPLQSIDVIENWCDGRAVYPLARAHNALREEWGLSRPLVVGYSGNFGVAHDFDTILEAATSLGKRRDVAFLFVGAGSRLASLQERVRERGLTNVLFKPYQPRERLAESLSVPDVHLVCLRAEMEGLVVPSKFYGVLAAGRPCLFIGDPHGEIASAIRELDCGFALPAGDAQELARVVGTLADDRSLLQATGAAARRAFDERFDRSIAAARWTEVLRRVIRAHVPRERPAPETAS